MKKSLLLYAAILAGLLNVFTYMYFSKQTDFEKLQHQKTKQNLAESEQKVADADYFSLAFNENAQNYFDNENVKKPLDYTKLIPQVTEKLKDFNDVTKGNPYTGQDQIGANKFIINKVKLLNHRWIIADFNDGEYWGDVLIKYFIDDNEQITFETVNSILYQK
jgi:hypothetical protein